MLVAAVTIGQIAKRTATKGANGKKQSAEIAMPKSGATAQYATESGVEEIVGPIPTARTLTAVLILGARVPHHLGGPPFRPKGARHSVR